MPVKMRKDGEACNKRGEGEVPTNQNSN